MDETAPVKRPNADYELSYPDKNNKINPENLTFHYNRERRLANAPQSVKDLYAEKKKSRFGLFGSLVADKPRRVLFFMIILLCALIFILNALGFLDNAYMLDGNKIEISGTIYEGTTYVVIKKTVRITDSYTGAVDIAVSPAGQTADAGDQLPVFYHRIFFSMNYEEVYRVAVPYDSPELLIVLQSDKDTLQMKVNSL